MNALSDIKSKIEKNKEEKRERLLASATALFAEKNFNNTSISDIVNKARVAKGTFYLYFKDKYDIRNQIVQEISTDLFDEAMKELKKHPEIALENACKYFDIDEVQKDIIRKHMFPATKELPSYKESFLVSIIDKTVAAHEMYRFKLSMYLGIFVVFVCNILAIQK